MTKNSIVVSKKTQRYNLNLQTQLKRLARKKIYFFKSKEQHDKIIGTYIKQYEFYFVRKFEA